MFSVRQVRNELQIELESWPGSGNTDHQNRRYPGMSDKAIIAKIRAALGHVRCRSKKEQVRVSRVP